jgi:murein DD-endopeptidase MepM/ murein hydrolase activator NlpD
MKREKSNKRISVLLIMMLVMTFVAFPAGEFREGSGDTLTYADTQDEIDQKQSEYEDIKQEQEEVQNELAAVADKITALQAEVDEINAQISQTNDEIAATQAKVDAKKADIQKKEQDIKKKKDEIQVRIDGLNARLTVMYKNGSVGFVDVLMGSNSISEFVSNVEMIQRIYENDVDLLKKLQEEQKKLEEEQNKLKEEQQALVEIQNELEAQKAQLQVQMDELDAKQSELASQKQILADKDAELQRDADALVAQIKELQDSQRVYEGGTFTWPVPSSSYISDSFGYRLHPIWGDWRLHTGTDIAASYDAEVVAAAAGKVIMASWYGGYGNCVMIDHGSGIVTLYGHLNGYNCYTGQEVSRGELIAFVGSTGNSTGPHCHFEVRINGEYVDPMSYF